MRVDIGGGVRLFFDVAGSHLAATDEVLTEKPTLLVLHGGPGGDHSSFRPWFDRFADTHHVVYLDHRGNGRSDGRHDPTGWDLDTWADDVVRFCDALELRDPVVCGTSFGGFVAMRYAARHPEHPSKLVLVSTMAHPKRQVTAGLFEELGGARAREVYERLYGGEPTTPELWAEYAEVCLPLYNRRPSPFGPRRSWQNTRVLTHFNAEFFEMDLRPGLADVRCPTLVLCGRDDPMTPVVASEEIASLVPGARLVVLDECGHGTYRDQPEATEAELRAFLAQ